MKGVTVVDHPLVQHKLTIMRNKATSTAGFRRLLREISLLLGYEVTRDLELTTTTIETPMQTMEAPTLEGKKLVFASVLRAGNGLLEGLLDLVPAARVAHIGLYRDHETLEAVEYFFKAPSDLGDRLVIVVDPMLATANSAIAAIDMLKGRGATNLRFSACSPRRKASSASPRRIPTCRSSPPPSTAISTRRATSCPASATPATACTGRSKRPPLPFVKRIWFSAGRTAVSAPALSARSQPFHKVAPTKGLRPCCANCCWWASSPEARRRSRSSTNPIRKPSTAS